MINRDDTRWMFGRVSIFCPDKAVCTVFFLLWNWRPACLWLYRPHTNADGWKISLDFFSQKKNIIGNTLSMSKWEACFYLSRRSWIIMKSRSVFGFIVNVTLRIGFMERGPISCTLSYTQQRQLLYFIHFCLHAQVSSVWKLLSWQGQKTTLVGFYTF